MAAVHVPSFFRCSEIPFQVFQISGSGTAPSLPSDEQDHQDHKVLIHIEFKDFWEDIIGEHVDCQPAYIAPISSCHGVFPDRRTSANIAFSLRIRVQGRAKGIAAGSTIKKSSE